MFIWDEIKQMSFVYLIDFDLPHVRFYSDNTFYDEYQNKPRFPQKSGILEIRSQITGKIIRLRPFRLRNFYSNSPWSGENYVIYPYRNLVYMNYSSYYAVCTGKVYSLKSNTYIVGELNRGGYLKLVLIDDFGNQNTITMHQIIARSFIPNPEGKRDIDHIDGDKLNNSYKNLRWVWPYENIAYARDIGLRKAVVTNDQIHAICKALENEECVADISRSLNVSRNIVSNIKCGDHFRISQNYNFKRNKNSRKKS